MRSAALLLAALLLTAGNTAAEPDRPAASPCAGLGSALSEIACELGRGLGEKARGALVVGVLPSATPPVAAKPELGARAAALVAGALAQGATAWPQVETLARA